MLARLRVLADGGRDFAFETTLAGRRHARWIGDLQSRGYRAHLLFLSLPTADLAVARVAERVKQGGHDVPEATVRRRFAAGLKNLFGLYANVVDGWQVYDNAALGDPRLLAVGRRGTAPRILDVAAWTRLVEQQR